MAKRTRRSVSGQGEEWEERQGELAGVHAIFIGILDALNLKEADREKLLGFLRYQAQTHQFRPAFHAGKSRVINRLIEQLTETSDGVPQ